MKSSLSTGIIKIVALLVALLTLCLPMTQTAAEAQAATSYHQGYMIIELRKAETGGVDERMRTRTMVVEAMDMLEDLAKGVQYIDNWRVVKVRSDDVITSKLCILEVALQQGNGRSIVIYQITSLRYDEYDTLYAWSYDKSYPEVFVYGQIIGDMDNLIDSLNNPVDSFNDNSQSGYRHTDIRGN